MRRTRRTFEQEEEGDEEDEEEDDDEDETTEKEETETEMISYRWRATSASPARPCESLLGAASSPLPPDKSASASPPPTGTPPVAAPPPPSSRPRFASRVVMSHPEALDRTSGRPHSGATRTGSLLTVRPAFKK